MQYTAQWPNFCQFKLILLPIIELAADDAAAQAVQQWLLRSILTTPAAEVVTL